MVSHFQLKELKNNMLNQEWEFSFYYKKVRYKGKYFKNGEILWIFPQQMDDHDKKFLTECVHDLMLYHVYEDH